MKKIGTFLVTSVFAAGIIFGGQGVNSMNTVNAMEINSSIHKSTTVYYYATPKLVVTGRDIKGGDVKAGDTFEMTIHLKNESNSTKLRNISIKLSSDENQIVTTSGSDTIYIQSLDKEEEYDVTVEMKAREDLEQKDYTVNVDYTYEDNNKNSFDGESDLTVPVVQDARLGISEVKLSKSELTVDGKTSLSFKVNNMGLDKLRNVTVEFEGDTIEEISYYVGNLDAGLSGSVDMTITPDKVGSDDIDIKVTYEDTAGNVKTYKDSVPLNVTEAETVEVSEAEEAPSVSTAMIGGGAICVIVLFALIAAIVKRARQKKFE